ncbi:hypothetical protein EVAR_31622_1 [Eumeta japonica]|uniref:DhaL domain-containing protein n=1 Tax=Eumeta variegata TaxID=151549 RepID=A0A4C1VYR6_EUMVA|nr:hypothetical protein EVAR_31622_1 [Eumeta japonica]
MKKFSEAVINYITTSSLQFPSKVIWELSEIAEDDMGGTSGGIYSLGLAAAAQSLAGEKAIDILAWQRSLESALQAISKYGGAEPGDRTMLDTLHSALKALRSGLKGGDAKKALTETIVAAEKGAKATITMMAKAGRAAYVSSEHLREEDAGAHAAALWTRAILSKIIKELYA